MQSQGQPLSTVKAVEGKGGEGGLFRHADRLPPKFNNILKPLCKHAYIKTCYIVQRFLLQKHCIYKLTIEWCCRDVLALKTFL